MSTQEGYSVQRMTRVQEVQEILDRAAREGWNPGLHDAECFWAVDPQGFFAGELNGRLVACGAALCYDAHFAFCGLYLVEPEHRGKGFGLALTRARLEHVGPRNAGLDGVLGMVDRYERLGYRRAHLSTRFGFTPTQRFAEQPAAGRLMPLSITPHAERDDSAAAGVSFAALADYDAQHFPVRREQFLRLWLTRPGSHVLVLVEGTRLKGYGVLRPCRAGHKVGPLFANDARGAEAILCGLCNHGLGAPVYLDVPEPNTAGTTLARSLGMEPSFACVRMYLSGDPGLPLGRIFGITSFEAG
jgi:GNAT superfamily N-acetyltransferase